MTPSSATPRRSSGARCRRRRNAAAAGTGATARALAAGLWRHRHGSSSTMVGNRGRTQCPCSRNHHGYGSPSMEKATKWDRSHYLLLDDILLKEEYQRRSRSSMVVALLESELDRARGRIVELEEEKRVTSKRLEGEKSRMKETVRLERKHRRELEAANARLLRELSEARLVAKQQARSYEMERKARELMEEACSELTREVEEDQAEVELLRRECLGMREEMEEERRMLQMADVWREERVQMKLCDAKLALEHKYSQLNRLQAEMETFLSVRRNKDTLRHDVDHGDNVDVDSVFEHFRRKEKLKDTMDKASGAGASSSSNGSVSPATDLFLAKSKSNGASLSSNNLDESVSPATDLFLAKSKSYSDDGSANDPSVSVPVAAPASTESFSHSNGASRRSKNTALIRRLWRTAITESRKKTQGNGAGWSAADHCSSSASSVNHQQQQQKEQRRGTQHYKQSLKEKLMEARMDDRKQ